MASTTSAEPSTTEIELKRRGRRRLIGAITIAFLGVAFLPMIFDGEPRREAESGMKRQEISVTVPAKEGLPPLVSPAAISSAPAPSTSVTVEQPKSLPAEPEKPAASVTSGTPLAVVSAPQKKPEPAAKPPVPSAGRTGFAVQLGVYADTDNAKQTISRMKEASLPVYTDSIPIKSGTATRVRLGPFPTREKADAALAQVKLSGADGKIVPLQ
jgi:DedD protein